MTDRPALEDLDAVRAAATCGHCAHPADWHDPHEGCVGPNGIGGIGSGDCTCTRNPESALRPLADTESERCCVCGGGDLPFCRLCADCPCGQTPCVRTGILDPEVSESAEVQRLRRMIRQIMTGNRAVVGRLEAEVAAARKFASEMRDFCSPHGVATDYADRLIEAMDRAKDAGQPRASTVRHVHVTITNPDPYTANRAALSLVDFIRGEFGGSLALSVTTDAREWGAADTTAGPDTPTSQTKEGQA